MFVQVDNDLAVETAKWSIFGRSWECVVFQETLYAIGVWVFCWRKKKIVVFCKWKCLSYVTILGETPGQESSFACF